MGSCGLPGVYAARAEQRSAGPGRLRAGAQPAGITAVFDGNPWFTGFVGNRIGRATVGAGNTDTDADSDACTDRRRPDALLADARSLRTDAFRRGSFSHEAPLTRSSVGQDLLIDDEKTLRVRSEWGVESARGVGSGSSRRFAAPEKVGGEAEGEDAEADEGLGGALVQRVGHERERREDEKRRNPREAPGAVGARRG